MDTHCKGSRLYIDRPAAVEAWRSILSFKQFMLHAATGSLLPCTNEEAYLNQIL